MWDVTAVIAVLALIVSALPYLHWLLRRGRLKLEIPEQVLITHVLGIPQAQLHVILMNVGGRAVRVRSIHLTFRRDQETFTLNARRYKQSPEQGSGVLLTPFSLEPKQEWGHVVVFVFPLTRQEEKRFRSIRAALCNDIFSRTPPNSPSPVEAREETLRPVIEHFDQRFKWEPGEYSITIKTIAEPAKASLEKTYRITLFESDSDELRASKKGYRYGADICFPTSPVGRAVSAAIHET